MCVCVGGGMLPDFFLLFSFPCSADHERDWPPCKVVFFGLGTNTLNVINSNNNPAGVGLRRKIDRVYQPFKQRHIRRSCIQWRGSHTYRRTT